MKYFAVFGFILLIAGCNPFPYRSELSGGAVWSDNDSSILYYRLNYWESEFFAFDTTHKWSPEFELFTINPNGSQDVALNLSREAWPEDLYYMKDAGYIVFSYHFDDNKTGEIYFYRISSGLETLLIADDDTFDTDYPIVVPSPGGEYLAVFETETENITNPLDIPVINLNVTFLSSSTLNEIYSWSGSFDEYFSYWWISDDILLVRDEVSWNEDTEEYQGYQLDPGSLSAVYGLAPDTGNIPVTSSSTEAADGTGVYFDDTGLNFF